MTKTRFLLTRLLIEHISKGNHTNCGPIDQYFHFIRPCICFSYFTLYISPKVGGGLAIHGLSEVQKYEVACWFGKSWTKSKSSSWKENVKVQGQTVYFRQQRSSWCPLIINKNKLGSEIQVNWLPIHWTWAKDNWSQRESSEWFHKVLTQTHCESRPTIHVDGVRIYPPISTGLGSGSSALHSETTHPSFFATDTFKNFLNR